MQRHNITTTFRRNGRTQTSLSTLLSARGSFSICRRQGAISTLGPFRHKCSNCVRAHQRSCTRMRRTDRDHPRHKRNRDPLSLTAAAESAKARSNFSFTLSPPHLAVSKLVRASACAHNSTTPRTAATAHAMKPPKRTGTTAATLLSAGNSAITSLRANGIRRSSTTGNYERTATDSHNITCYSFGVDTVIY